MEDGYDPLDQQFGAFGHQTTKRERRARRKARRGFERDLNDFYFVPKPASEPTDTVPGSIHRIEVYEKRVRDGEEVFHSDDLKNL